MGAEWVDVAPVNALEEQRRPGQECLGRMTGPVGDARAEELEAQVGCLAKEHTGPVLEENVSRGVHEMLARASDHRERGAPGSSAAAHYPF